MSIFLHIFCAFPALIKLNKQELGILESVEEKITVETDEEDFLLEVYPIDNSNDFKFIPFFAKIKSENKTLTSSSDYVIITDFDNGHYEINISPMQINLNNSAQIVSFEHLAPSVTAQLLDKGNFELNIWSENLHFNFPVSEKLIEHKLEFSQTRNKDFVFLSGKTRKNKDYLMVICNYFCNLEIIADKIEKTENEISSLSNLYDIANHGIVQRYELKEKGFELVDEYTVFTEGKPFLTTNRNIIPWAFMEAVNIGDIKLARQYLDDDLNRILSDEHISKYFGDYSEIVWNKYQNKPETLCLIYNGNPRTTKVYEFQIKQNKIYNIVNLD